MAVPEHFIGRAAELNWLLDHLRRGCTTGVTAVQGLGGIGKTSLAAVAVRSLREEGRFRNGVGLAVCLGKSDAIQVLREVLSRFEPQRRLPSEATIIQLCDVAHRLLDNRDVLVVLDNVEPELDLEQLVGPLHAAKATLLLTSRARLAVGECIDLPLLTADHAKEVFVRYYGEMPLRDFAPDDALAVAQIVDNLGRHTLAVKLAARYALGTRRKLTHLADELRNPHEVLTIADAIDRIFLRSFAALPQPAQQLFAAFGAFATPEFSRNAALALARALQLAHPHACVDVSVERALVEAALLPGPPEGTDVERLQLHPLLRVFASEQLRKLPQAFEHAARHAVATYYATYASRPLRAALGPDEINITEALIWTHKHRLHDLVTKICLGMQAFWRDFGRAGQTQRYVTWGIEAAEQIVRTNNTSQAHLSLATLRLAQAHFLRLIGKLGEAEALAELVLPAFREAGDLPEIASTLTVLGNIARDRADFDAANAYLREALAIFQDARINDLSGQGLILCFLGQIAQRCGQTELAGRQLRQALATYREVPDSWGIGLALILLGRILLQQGRLIEADVLYREALAIHQRLEARRSMGADISSLGEIALGLGRLDEAERHFTQSLVSRGDSRDRRGEAVDFTLLGKLACVRERFGVSERHLQQALSIWEEVQDPRGKGWVLSEHAQLALACGRVNEAEQLISSSLKIRQHVGDRRGEATDLRILSEIVQARGDNERAEAMLHRAEEIAAEIQDWPEQARIRLNLAAIVASRGELGQAEALFRGGLDLARETDAELEIAQAQAALGAFLAVRHRIDEGCRLLSKAWKSQLQMGIPSAERTRELMCCLGCEMSE